MIPYNKANKANAKNLRKNMTPEERRLWYDFLKRLPLCVKRQFPIEGYIVDFYIPSKKLVIEVDGIQHGTRDALFEDRLRDEALAGWGITVKRFTNRVINDNLGWVAQDVLSHLGLTHDDLLYY